MRVFESFFSPGIIRGCIGFRDSKETQRLTSYRSFGKFIFRRSMIRFSHAFTIVMVVGSRFHYLVILPVVHIQCLGQTTGGQLLDVSEPCCGKIYSFNRIKLSQPNPKTTQQQLNLTRLRLDLIINPNPPTHPTPLTYPPHPPQTSHWSRARTSQDRGF